MRGGRVARLTAVAAAMAMVGFPAAQATPDDHVTVVESDGTAAAGEWLEPELEPDLGPIEADVETATVDSVPVGQVVTLTAPAGDLRVVGVTWDDEGDSDHAHEHRVEVELRTHDGNIWSTWEEIHVEDLAGTAPSDRAGSEPVAVIDVEQVEVTVSAESPELLASVELVVIDPGEDGVVDTLPEPAEPAALSARATASAVPTPPAGRPRINSRAAWGANEAIRTWKPELGRVTGAVVHHTAGTNNYTSAQVPGIIRGIYQYHAVTRNWGDIGYNVLIDRFGRAWEGRYGGVTNAVVGAHAQGANATTFGVSLMGNFETAQVSTAAFRMLARVIGWTFSWHGITTSGSAVGVGGRSMNRIVGHRDASSTACPGRNMYSRLGELRSLVAQYQRLTPPREQPSYRTVRLGGDDRYETAVMTQRWTHLISTTRTVFIATGAEYADALSAASAAARSDSPVLLVRPDRVSSSVMSELQRTNPSRIYVLGGPDAISNSVLQTLRSVVPDVRRLSGSDRYGTAAAVSQMAFGSVNEVFISSGQAFPDAVSAGAAAARRGAPMLLTRSTTLTPATSAELRRTQPSRVRIVGGEHVITDAVRQEIQAILPSATIERLSGPDRYATSAAVVRSVWPGGASRAYYATGLDWPDALSAGWAAGAQNAPVLLVRGRCTPRVVQQESVRLGPSTAMLVGGTTALRDDAVERRC